MTLGRHLLRLMVMCSALLAVAVAHAAGVVIVLSDSSPPYQEFADAVRAELKRDTSGPEVQVLDRDQAAARSLADASFVIGVGGQAAQALSTREAKPPTLFAMLPRSAYERLMVNRRDDKRITALFIDQPPNRYIDLIRIALPDVERIGMLAGQDSRDTVARLAQAARDRKLRPMVETVNSESDIYPAMQRMFADGGLLLATPDTTVFNSQTIQNILMGAYRFHVPVIGFSPTYVNKAGALAALYSTPAQIGQQAGEIARNLLAGGALPPPQYPRLFSVGVNAYVARSMGLQIDSEASIRERIERNERLERGL